MKNAILINDTSTENHIGSKTVIENINKLSLKYGVKINSTFTREDITNWCDRLDKKIENCDIVLINGEGSLHDSPPFFDIIISRMDKFKEKKIVLLNSLWQRMEGTRIKDFLVTCDIITFRESLSANEFKKQYPNIPCEIIPDVIFATPIYNLCIGFSDSVIIKFREELSKHYNYFPMNFESGTPDVLAYVAWLKSLDLHITGRFHGVCLCALVGTKFLTTVSNSHKIDGILKDMGCSSLIIKSNNEINANKLLEVDLAQDKIKKYVEDAKIKIEDLFKRIGEL